MKHLNKILSIALTTVAMIPFVSCDKDSDSAGGVVPGGKQLAKVTSINVRESLDNGVWMTERYEEEYINIVWSGNRVLSFSTNNGNQTYDYDNQGRITKVTNPDGTCTPIYDASGRIVKTTRSRMRDDEQRETYYNYTYDDSGNLIKVYVTNSYNSNWDKYTYRWENGNVVRVDQEEYYDGNTYSYSSNYTYDNKVNVYSCLPPDILLAAGSHGAPTLSRNNVFDEVANFTYSGNYLIKTEFTDIENGTRRWTEINYYEYTDGTGRR